MTQAILRISHDHHVGIIMLRNYKLGSW